MANVATIAGLAVEVSSCWAIPRSGLKSPTGWVHTRPAAARCWASTATPSGFWAPPGDPAVHDRCRIDSELAKLDADGYRPLRVPAPLVPTAVAAMGLDTVSVPDRHTR
jgi:hypothetical protein